MNKKKAYHQAYLNKYNKINSSGETNNSSKNVLPFLIFISLPFIFTVVLNFLLLIDNNNGLRIYSNKYSSSVDGALPHYHLAFSDEIIYKNILGKDTLDNKIKNSNNPLFFQDRFDTSKFEKLTLNKNNLSNKSGLSKKITPPNDLISLKKLNLLSNISQKKKEFINIVLPIIVDQNKKIISLRQRLIDSRSYLNQNKTLSQTDQSFIKNLTTKYSVSTKNRHKIDIINDLLIYVDVIPNSIALAQAATESGWGSSRFATEFNALYGEYTYDSTIGIVPSRRDEGEKHLVRYFKTIDKSVESYFLNINSHFAYSKFRKFRKILRDQNNPFSINLLVNKLDVYAEDEEYVDTIISIIHDNKLTQYDKIISFIDAVINYNKNWWPNHLQLFFLSLTVQFKRDLPLLSFLNNLISTLSLNLNNSFSTCPLLSNTKHSIYFLRVIDLIKKNQCMEDFQIYVD